jgi:hypothetical protein
VREGFFLSHNYVFVCMETGEGEGAGGGGVRGVGTDNDE